MVPIIAAHTKSADRRARIVFIVMSPRGPDRRSRPVVRCKRLLAETAYSKARDLQEQFWEYRRWNRCGDTPRTGWSMLDAAHQVVTARLLAQENFCEIQKNPVLRLNQ